MRRRALRELVFKVLFAIDKSVKPREAADADVVAELDAADADAVAEVDAADADVVAEMDAADADAVAEVDAAEVADPEPRQAAEEDGEPGMDDPGLLLPYLLADWELAGTTEGAAAPSLTEDNRRYARNVIHGVLANCMELDSMIGSYSGDWAPERLGRVERNVLRMGFYEMLYDSKLAPAIAINEAVELTKKFGTEEGARYVNGILGKKAEELGNA